MKTTIRLAIISVFFLLVNSCKENTTINLENDDYLIFGHFYGECAGEECIEIFKLEQNRLFEDKKDIYPSATSFYNGDYVQLNQSQFEATKDLVNYFPQALLAEKSNIIGQPDAGDWGGLYIEYKHKEIRKFWVLDQHKDNVPPAYYPFIDEVNLKIRQLK